jgi:hypothetical protein
MPFTGGSWGGSRTGVLGREEFLKFPAGLDAIKSVVIAASTVASTSASGSSDFGRRILKAGTLLTRIGGSGNQYKQFASGSGEVIEGVLGLDIEFLDGTSNSDQPAPLYYHGCVFDQDKLVDFATYSARARQDLVTNGTNKIE